MPKQISSADILTVEETIKKKTQQGYEAAATGRTELARSIWNEALSLNQLNSEPGQRRVLSLGYLAGIGK